MNMSRNLCDIVSPNQKILEERICGKCGDPSPLVQIGIPPYAFTRHMKCRCIREEENKKEIADAKRVAEDRQMNIKLASYMPSKYTHANFTNPPPSIPSDMKKIIFPALQAIVEKFPDLRGGHHGYEITRYRLEASAAVVIGDYGTGKTYAMAAMLNLAREKMIAGYLLNITDFMRELHASYNGDSLETENKVLGRYEKTPILVIDDLDKFQATEWSCSILYNLLQSREGRPTFVTSNYSAAQLLSETFEKHANKGRGIIERIIENQWFEVRGKSVRRKVPTCAT